MAEGENGSEEEGTVANVRIRVLGPVLVDDAPVAGPLPRRLIVALALAAPLVASSQRLVDDVWGDDLPDRPRATLQTLVSRARRLLGADAIGSGPAGYRLTVGTDLDIARRASDPDDLAAALALWHGDPGDDLGDAPVAESLRSQAAALHSSIRRARARALVDEGRLDDAVAALTPLVETSLVDEDSAVLLMRAHAENGHKTDALAVFARLRGALAETLGTAPGSDAIELNTKLLRDDSPQRKQIGVRARRGPLIGRDADIAAVESAIASHRLTTILGVGGLGKTSLAHEVARRSQAPLTVVVELAGATSPDDVLITMTSTLGIRTVSSVARLSDPHVLTDLRSRAIATLAERDTLMVLDNCEHLVDAAASLADDVLSAVPTLRILATSRSPLAIEGEQVIALPQLSLTDAGGPGSAIELFLQRARAIRPGAELDPDAVHRICASLDGLPLAIELAAARVRSMSLDDIERRLRDRFALLTAVDRSAPARHRTLFAVIDWSWKLLEPRQRKTLRRLSLFADGFTAEAAGEVAGDGADVIDDLDALVMQSLVQVRDEGSAVRYRLLETVGEFARDRLDDAGERTMIDARYDEWITRLALDLFDQMLGAQQLDALTVAVTERENLVAALRHAITRSTSDVVYALFGLLSLVWSIRGEHEEFLGFGTDVLAASDDHAVSPRIINAAALGLSMLAVTFLMFGANRVAYPALSRLRHFVSTKHVTDARALTLTEMLALPPISTDAGAESLFSWVDSQLQHDDDARAAYAAVLGANGAENLGEYRRALEYARAGHARATALHDTWLQAMAASVVAQLLSQNERVAEVRPWAHAATDALAKIGADEDMVQARWMLSLAELHQGDASAARAMLADMGEDSPGELRGLLLALDAEIAVHDGRLTDAIAALDAGLAQLEISGGRSAPWLVLAMATRALTRRRSGVPRESLLADSDRLSARVRALIRVRGWSTDQPVTGSGIAAVGAIALDDAATAQTGVELLVLAEQMGYRRDFSVLSAPVLLAQAEQVRGADAVAEARAFAASLSPFGRLDRAAELLTLLARAQSGSGIHRAAADE
ncbi:ATP-binding protein [Paramicrobacterium fandaimingii]|uniref:ATP-binding protein n=1 Tax=Paramicrobacterium fandaimingii TaxID=2708079 RepID=UPI00141F7308|nr:BTAD domain-containing putative transcriptional regulator [Microbacterium fandaimingii]